METPCDDRSDDIDVMSVWSVFFVRGRLMIDVKTHICRRQTHFRTLFGEKHLETCTNLVFLALGVRAKAPLFFAEKWPCQFHMRRKYRHELGLLSFCAYFEPEIAWQIVRELRGRRSFRREKMMAF